MFKKLWVVCSRKGFSLSLLFRGVIIVSVILAIWKMDWVWVGGTCIALFISFLPCMVKRDVNLSLPWIFDFLIAFVSILHIGGRLLDFYIVIPNYQLVTRFFISILVAFISLALIYIFDEHWDGLMMDKYAMVFVTVIITMAMGVLLEFIKWLNISGTYYVKTNQVLMMNLLADTCAGVIIAFIGVHLIKSGKMNEITKDFGEQIDELLIHRVDENSHENEKG